MARSEAGAGAGSYIPESAIVPARLVVSARGSAAVQQSLAQLPQATPALVRLMRTLESPDEE